MPQIIPFYAAGQPELFEIERRCMDRDGKVISWLKENLPNGRVLDVGAGNGFTALQLTSPQRTVIPMEPVTAIADLAKSLPWVKGVAQDLPFHDNTFDGAYATWAFFFANYNPDDCLLGLAELRRVVKKGGKMVIVDNAGNDEFTSFAQHPPAFFDLQHQWWEKQGFRYHLIDTSFRFDAVSEAQQLMSLYYGEKGALVKQMEFTYRVAVYEAVV